MKTIQLLTQHGWTGRTLFISHIIGWVKENYLSLPQNWRTVVFLSSGETCISAEAPGDFEQRLAAVMDEDMREVPEPFYRWAWRYNPYPGYDPQIDPEAAPDWMKGEKVEDEKKPAPNRAEIGAELGILIGSRCHLYPKEETIGVNEIRTIGMNEIRLKCADDLTEQIMRQLIMDLFYADVPKL